MSDLKTMARFCRALASELGEQATEERDAGREGIAYAMAAQSRAYAGAGRRLEALALRDIEVIGAVPPDDD